MASRPDGTEHFPRTVPSIQLLQEEEEFLSTLSTDQVKVASKIIEMQNVRSGELSGTEQV